MSRLASDMTSQIEQQQNVQRDLCIDGYIAQTFDPRVAREYLVSLLKREPGEIQLQADVAGTGAFLATPPPGPTSGQHSWVIDYAVRNIGPVIRQIIWTPKKSSDKLRWVGHEQLHPPIFFIHKNGRDLGLPLTEAAGGDCMRLRGAEEAAPVGSSAHAQIRINWCGYVYLDWSEQISIQKQTQPRERISLETFAKHVAKKTVKFMEVVLILLPRFLQETDVRIYQVAKDNDNDSDQRYRIGDKHITPRDVTLIGTVQVTHSSWMPILQLNNGYAQVR
ncbi:hypothetical protein F5888DRAFT_1808755 [Russula emetica]|nr:hypothetical protein F5888DRAFT_1812961 [Russula emetica]KAF8489564.1 hypothetical protein F5888DRAFT_1808755 [Russula emetica]